jgi:hypothetical protein
MPRKTPKDLARYEARLAELLREQRLNEKRAFFRMRRRFRRFARDTIASIPGNYALNQAVIPELLGSMARDLDQLAVDLGVELRSGMRLADKLHKDLVKAFGEEFIEEVGVLGVDFIGTRPEIFNASFGISLDLVGGEAGLTKQMHSEIRNALQRAILGAEGKTYKAIDAISAALGRGEKWTYQAERIYRTEVNRFFSIATDASFNQLAREQRLSKRWYWSGIDRREHAAIHGQTVPWKGFFRVKSPSTKNKPGRVYRIAYPRAVRDAKGKAVPGSVTINCGCWHAPVPARYSGVTSVPERLAPGVPFRRAG